MVAAVAGAVGIISKDDTNAVIGIVMRASRADNDDEVKSTPLEQLFLRRLSEN